MSRSKAKDTLSLDKFKEAMTGRVWRSDHARRLPDEAPRRAATSGR